MKRPIETALVAGTLTFAGALAGCGGTSHCVEGTAQGCVCSDGRTGSQVCNASGTFEACTCTGTMLDAALEDDAASTMADAFSPEPDAASCSTGASCACPAGVIGYCEADACVCDPGPVPCAEDVDWLFLVDSSNSMVEEQAALAAELPRLVRILASGDANEDGTPDFAPVRSLHLGVVTPDLGAGDHAGIPTCREGWGDDGILRTAGTGAGCTTAPSGVFSFTSATDDAATFARSFACVAQSGTGGCGFEQQLEAPLRALSPSSPTAWTRTGYVPPTFRDGSSGHALDANAGFLRDGSVLAMTLVSDEDDCSTPDTGLFVFDDPRYAAVGLNTRCITFTDALYAERRYVDGFLGLRPHPGLLVYSVIGGMPVEPFTDYDTLLADPRMEPRPDPTDANRIVPACTSTAGSAFPGRRMVEVARDLDRAGVQTSVSSICASDYQTAVSDVVRALVAARGSCT